MNNLCVIMCFYIINMIVMCSYVIYNVIKIVFWSCNCNKYYWFKDSWLCWFSSFFKCKWCSNFEGCFRWVNIMVWIIVKFSFYVNYWIFSKNIVCYRFYKFFFNGWNKFMRNYIIDDSIFEFEFFIFFVWCKFNLNIIKLIFIIRLVFEEFMCLCRSVECFVVWYLGCFNVCFNFEFMFYMVNKDIKVKFIYFWDNCFISFNVSFNVECWVFFSKFLKGDIYFILVSFRFWFNY